VVFDKTGTLTKGQQGVVSTAAVEGWETNQALALAAAVESDSEHIVAQGLRQAALDHQLLRPRATDFEALKGRGIRAGVDGQTFYVGGPNLLAHLQLALPERLQQFTREAERKGQTVVYLISEQPVAAFALADVIRPESAQAVAALQAMNVEVVMLTGDSQAVAQAVADELHITRFFAGVLPEHKDQKVAELQREGKRVAMVGDGVNDAPALTRADVGIAIGGGTDVAIESAGIILVQSNPLDVVKIVKLSRASYRKMIENLVWATGYNVVALPLAAGVLAPLGILLTPAVGALFMSLSTVIVALNAQLLRRVRL
jgi:Cu2+-exporting ATPase